MENTVPMNEDEYTLKAEVKLRTVEENEQLQKAIKSGDQSSFDDIMKHMLDQRLTWGAHIKRYIYEKAYSGKKDMKMKDLSREEMEQFIYDAFEENGMKNRGSIHPGTATTLKSQLGRWLDSPVEKISRDTCFLFAFGLNMSEVDVSYMLQNVLRKADFNAKDYKEAIYYYCLCNNYKYKSTKNPKEMSGAKSPEQCKSVEDWLEKYEQLEVSYRYKEPLQTYILVDSLREITEDVSPTAFVRYLEKLKRQSEDNKNSNTAKRILKEKLNSLLYWLSPKEYILSEEKSISDYAYDMLRQKEEAVDLGKLVSALLTIPTEDIQLSLQLDELVREDIIRFPSWTEESLTKKIYEKTTHVSREDILIATFLVEMMEFEKRLKEETEGQLPGKQSLKEGKSTYQKRKAWFIQEANWALEESGFCEMYLLNPFELFLVSCLLQNKPMEYFLAAWKSYRGNNIREKKSEKKSKEK